MRVCVPTKYSSSYPHFYITITNAVLVLPSDSYSIYIYIYVDTLHFALVVGILNAAGKVSLPAALLLSRPFSHDDDVLHFHFIITTSNH